jgi:hypothetical protein
MKRGLLCSSFILLLFISVNSQADLVPQPSQPPSTTTFMAYDSNANVGYGAAREADNFTLPTASSPWIITGVKWWGFDAGGGWSGTSNFTFTFYAGTLGTSGSATSATLTSAVADASHSPPWAPNSVYVYTASLSVPLNAGTYWLSIYDTTTTSTWGWMMSDGGTSYEQLYGSWSQMSSNAAFEITYQLVPIPAAGWLLATGVVALVVIRRRKR